MSNTPTTTPDPVIAELSHFYGGGEVRTSEWLEVTQEHMDQFAEVTHDPDWMHIDPERARRDGPFEGTIAFGFWTMSLLTPFSRQIIGGDYPPAGSYGFNYGFNRLRLMAPVPIGSRIRCRMKLLGVEPRGEGRYLMCSENSIEIEGEEKPAAVIETVVVYYP